MNNSVEIQNVVKGGKEVLHWFENLGFCIFKNNLKKKKKQKAFYNFLLSRVSIYFLMKMTLFE